MNEPVLQKAMDTLTYLSHDEEARMLYEMRQKALHDEASMIEGAKAEGIAEGEQKARLELAKNLLDKGMDKKFILEVTGLTEAEWKDLIENKQDD